MVSKYLWSLAELEAACDSYYWWSNQGWVTPAAWGADVLPEERQPGKRLILLQLCIIIDSLPYLTFSGEQAYKFSYLFPTYVFIFASSSVFVRTGILRSLAGLTLNAHPLPFYEGQMHYLRLVPSYALLSKMVRGLFNILVCLLPAYSLWFLRGFHHPVFDILYLEHLFLANSPCSSRDWWRRMPAAPGNSPYSLGWGCSTAVSDLPHAFSWCCPEKQS